MEPTCANNTALEAQEATGIIAAFNEFKLFPKLPLELRLLIFAAAVAGVEPRNIEIFKSENGRPSSFCLASSASIPGLLHTCREARDVAKKTYKLAFAGRPVRGPIYFDWDKDSLVFLNEFNFETFFALSENPNPDPFPMVFIYSRLEMLQTLAFGPGCDKYFQGRWNYDFSIFCDVMSHYDTSYRSDSVAI
ncbi:hypothetical protein BKA61DRAFT_666559 [Leptodontidium sp. MPI-SDFR-AT-0119]|nr:hypothetical protein BKA61DRAFT_666559 [Leptodontidium sp. MPI-SDFR-AT-0119]